MGIKTVPNGPAGESGGDGSSPVGTQPPAETDVFMCYNSTDRREVKAIHKTLVALGLNVWFDETELLSGSVVQQLQEAIQRARAAAVIIGREGTGKWQGIEYETLLRRRLENDEQFRLVPVVLPNVPEDAVPPFLAGFARFQFEATLNDKTDLKRLYKLLTNREWPNGAYEIHIEVEDAEVTCFAAVPQDRPADICEAIESAVKVVNDHLETNIEFRRGAADSVKLYREIRAAEVIVVDCSPDERGARDPMVLYQLGLAQAIGKPIIIVTVPGDKLEEVFPTPHVVYCNRAEPDYRQKLQEELVEQMKDLAGYAILGLVADDCIDIAAAYSDLSRPRPMLFKRFQTVFREGLTIHRYFREIAKHVHRLSADIEDLRIDLRRAADECPSPEEAIARTRRTFNRYLLRAFSEFMDIFGGADGELSFEVLGDFASLTDTEAWRAFEFLKQKTAGHALECIEKSARDFQSTGTRIAHFTEVFDAFGKRLDEVANRFESKLDPEPQIENLADRIQNLERATSEVDRSTTEMLTDLLEVIGGRGAQRAIAAVEP